MNPGLVHSPSNNVAVNRRESKDDRSVSPAYVQRIISPLKRHDRFQQVPRVCNNHMILRIRQVHEDINSQISSILLLD
jgi:hypothetical protein